MAPINWKNKPYILNETILNLMDEPGKIAQIQRKLKNCINLDGANKLLDTIGF